MTDRNYREDFPLLRNNDTAYIDNAATAQKPQVVIDAEATENRRFLRQVADAPSRARVQRQQADVFVIDDDIACVAGHNPDHHVEGGRFTGAVRAEQADNLARVNGETDIFHHAAAFIRFSEILRS